MLKALEDIFQEDKEEIVYLPPYVQLSAREEYRYTNVQLEEAEEVVCLLLYI